MKKFKTYAKTLAMVAIIIGLVIIWWMSRSPDVESNPDQHKDRKARAAERATQRTKRRSKMFSAADKPSLRNARAKKIGEKPEFDFDSAEHPYSMADKKVAKSLQEALDEDDYDAVLKAAAEALKSDNPDVRQNAVDALGWYGEQALAELTVCMADPDEDVAQSAMNHWEEGVSEMESAHDKLQLTLYALNTIADEDALTMIGSHFACAAMELIDDEDDESRASKMRVEVVQALVDVMAAGKDKNMEAAMDAYEEITGTDWISLEEAEKYLADPDNYEAPEKEDDDD